MTARVVTAASQSPAVGSDLGLRAADRDDPLTMMVRYAFLVRLLALVAGTMGLLGRPLTPQALGAIIVLAGSSFVGLSQPHVLQLVMRHPGLAMGDLLIVLGVFAVLGVQSPLALGTLSTALLLGLLFPARVSVLLGITLVLGYAGAALIAERNGEDLGFFLALGIPATYLCLMGLGQSIRRMEAARAQAERELAAVLQASAAAGERVRLAREVHDSLAKSLQGLAFGAAALPTLVDRDGERAREEARALARGASQAVQEARTLLTRMRSDEPHRPFHDVLQSVLDAWSGQHGRSLKAELDPVALDADARYELLAAMREALENIQRHAPDAQTTVRLTAGPQRAQLVIQDDGPGFDPACLPDREAEGHFGVRGMHERLAAVGGQAVVESAPGAGTRVVLEVPQTDDSLLPRTNGIR